MRMYGRHLTREEEFAMKECQLYVEMERAIMNDDDSPKSSKCGCCILM